MKRITADLNCARTAHGIRGQLVLAGWVFVLLFTVIMGTRSVSGRGEEAFCVSLPEKVLGYTPCEILITSPQAGEVTLRLLDSADNCWLTLKTPVTAGENRLSWDGLGTYEEKLLSGPYRFYAELRAADSGKVGQEERTDGLLLSETEARFTIGGTTPTLVYALPSSDTLYLDHQEKWFVECYVTAECLVAMEVHTAAGELVFTREVTMKDPEGDVMHWAGLTQVAPGEYTVSLWSKLNVAYTRTFPLRVEAVCPTSREITETGPILPERGRTETEIWEIMMKPSVVIAGNSTFRRYVLYRKPNASSRSAGSLRCATQGLEVLDIEGKWAHVRAWNHEDGQEITGYLQLRLLTVQTPGNHYGVLIDKRDQTLTVYQDGHAIGTVPVSTGLATPGNAYRETPAGAFLTDVHTGPSFAQEGYRYEYPLKYDAGNMIHGAGFVRRGRQKDYSDNLPLLGQKASHGCTRVSPFATEEYPINMYWLWLHLPYHTRVIVLED